MSFTENGNGLSAADVAAVMGNNSGFGFGNDGGGLFWLLVLFLFGFGNGGWGNGYGGNIGGEIYPWMNQSQQINDGFRDQMINGNIQGIQNSITSGFGDVQNSLCGGFAGVNASINNAQNGIVQQMYANQIAGMNQSFNNQTAMLQGFNGIQSQFANCCCENRLGLANLGADIAREACADRQAVSEAMMGLTAQNNANTNALVNTINGGIQSLKDQLCDYRNEQKDNTIAQLRSELMFARGQASQDVQTAAIQAGQRALANEVEQYIRPQINPSYIVPNPYAPGCGCNNGCCNA